jgi:hypothetical protein
MTGAPRRTITTLVALVAAAGLAGCGGGTTPPPAEGGGVGPITGPTPSTTASRNVPAAVVMVIRHGEKPDDDSGPGLDVHGNEDDSSLTEVGWDRAHRLADLFDQAPAPRPGLSRPGRIYAAGANDDGEGARTRETVQPLANRLGLAVDTRFGKGDEDRLVEHVITRPGPALISWQHSGIPSIAEALGPVTPTPPTEWPDDRFDVVWTFTRTADGWRFDQLPELLMPQDQAAVIQN